jgi:hypothetical protein
VSIFCQKLADSATSQQFSDLAAHFHLHAVQEERHGKMLASLVDGNQRFILLGNGRFASMKRSGNNEELLARPSLESPQGTRIKWNSSKFPGEQITAIFENLDGLSQRYFSLKLL